MDSNAEYLVFQLTVTDSQGLQNSGHCVIYLTDSVFEDTDGDGMADNWETAYFGTLDRNGDGDADEDSISDLDEYLNGLDPTRDTRGDINQDGQADLADAIIALQIISDTRPGTLIRKASDISGDGKIGLEEAIYLLQHIGE